MTIEWPGLGASAVIWRYWSSYRRVCVCVCVCALHGYRAPLVIWSTSLRRSGLVGCCNWQLHALLLLPQTSNLKTPHTRHHLLQFLHRPSYNPSQESAILCRRLCSESLSTDILLMLASDSAETGKGVLVLKVCNSRLNTKYYGWAVGRFLSYLGFVYILYFKMSCVYCC